MRLLTAVAAWFAAAAALGSPAGHLVLIGGGSKPPAALRTFVEQAGGPSSLIVVLPTASELPSTGGELKALFEREHGCTNVEVMDVRSREDAARADYVDRAATAGGFFFSGGDQRRITAALLGTPLGRAITDAHRRGAAIGGTSAGTACQSSLMITGEGDFSVITAANVELAPGLGLLPGVIVDQHFIARQRANRLISVVLEHPELLGVGIDEGTAVWVRPDRTLEVIGEGWVMVLDAAAATVERAPTADARERLGVRNLVVHLLLPGQVFDLTARRARGSAP